MFTQDKKEIDHNEYWYIKDNPLSKVGIFPYLGKQISPELEPDKIYQVLRPAEELQSEATLNSFKLLPIVDEHMMLGTKPGMKPAEDKGVHGVIGEDVKADGNLVTGDLKIFSEHLKDQIENGKKELSMGYFCDYELTPGEFNGKHYDAIQRNIRGNHVALVDEGRMGAEVRVMDKIVTFDTIKEINEMTLKTKQNQTKSLKTSVMDEDVEELETVETQTEEDEDVDKRKIIDEVGGFLKEKGLTDEDIRFVIGKMEKEGYNDSETGANDETEEGKAAQPEDEDGTQQKNETQSEDEDDNKPCTDEDANSDDDNKQEGVSMDSMFKAIALRDSIVEAVRPLIGDNTKFKSMTAGQVARYACDKLDLKAPKGKAGSTLRGYLAAYKKFNKKEITYGLDSAVSTTLNGEDAAFKAYLKGE